MPRRIKKIKFNKNVDMGSFTIVKVMNGDYQIINLDNIVRFAAQPLYKNSIEEGQNSKTWVPALQVTSGDWINIHTDEEYSTKESLNDELMEIITDVLKGEACICGTCAKCLE